VLEETEGIFKQEGRIWIWVTDDENKMPVILKSKIAIGNVEVKLESYTLGS
jgi:negative regulator of genetic competence, sporulation and motility